MKRVLVNLIQMNGKKGGLEVYNKELYKAFGELDTEFEFIGLIGRELEEMGYEWFPGRVVKTRAISSNQIAWGYAELITNSIHSLRIKPSLIHAPAMLAPLYVGCPLVTTFHDLTYFTRPELIPSRTTLKAVRHMERISARQSSRIITISRTSAEDIQRHLGISGDKIDIIPLAARQMKLAISGQSPKSHFLAMGQRSPYKDFTTIIYAWSEIPAQVRPQLIITGSFGSDPLAPMVKKLGLEAWVRLLDWVSDEELIQLRREAIAIIDSTIATGFSLPAIEAMFDGVPIVLADIPVFREIAQDVAYFYEPSNPRQLSGIVMSLSQSGAEDSKVKRGVARASAWSWRDVALETASTFRRVLNN